jgi:hypothetical protein
MPLATIDGTGWMGNAPQALSRLVASSPTFRSVVGSNTEDDALQHVYFLEASDREGEVDPMPRAIVAITEFVIENRSSGGWWGEGSLALVFEFQPPPQYADNIADGYIWFCNTIGEIVKEMSEFSEANVSGGSGTGVYLNAREFRVLEGPAPCVPDEENGTLFFSAILMVRWC